MADWNSKNFLVRATLLRDRVPDPDVFPFTIPAIRAFEEMAFERPVTFLIGENGAGKSTLLEAIAISMGLNAEGGSRNFRFATRPSHSDLHRYLRLSRSTRRARDRYFLRAETYYNLATNIEDLDVGSFYGDRALHEQSHGESFFALFMHRLRGDGLYILDEPEAALSPSRQLAFLTRLHALVQAGAQFLIATHSPILMAYPDSDIYLLADGPPRPIGYRETEHYTVTRNFLTRTDQMLGILLGGQEPPAEE